MLIRIWLGDGYVAVGQSVKLQGGYNGYATITAIQPISELAYGTQVVDPRTLELVTIGEFYQSEYHIQYADSCGMDGVVPSDEVFPVIQLASVATAD